MEVRKEESKGKKFTFTPEDFNTLVNSSLMEAIGTKIETQGFSVKYKGMIYPSEVLFRISLVKEGDITWHNFIGSIDHDTEAKDSVDRLKDVIDAIASMMDEYLNEGDELEMPLDFHEYDFESRKVYLMYNKENYELVDQANDLLGEDSAEPAEEEVGMDFFKDAEERFKSNLH
ncbi:MAG: hypothetical protein AB8E15_00290 [Bdellovibrionales bacterium]